MFKALLFSAVLIASVGFEVGTQTADACGVKMGAKRGPKINRAAKSNNPSRILIVGSRDGALVKSLKTAGHKTEYASSVSEAKHSRYDLIVADESEVEAARSRFGNTQVLKKKSDSNATVKTAETMLARTAVGKSERERLVATGGSRGEVVAAGSEGVDRSRPTAAGSEGVKTPILAARVAAEGGSEKPTRVAEVTKTAPEVREPKVEPKNTVVPATRTKVKDPAPEPEVIDKPTPAGKKVAWTRTFQFGTNKTEITGAAKRKLTANAQWLQQNPDATLTIEGHTDSVGDEAYNMDLSERRANVARDFMISFGIDGSRITVEAKGEESPAFEPSTSGKNRRIVLIKN